MQKYLIIIILAFSSLPFYLFNLLTLLGWCLRTFYRPSSCTWNLYPTPVGRLSIRGALRIRFNINSSRFYSTNNTNNEENNPGITINPVKSYSNADTQMSTIFKDNKGKAGIYRWVNINNGKSYIGSSKNLSVRLKQYYTTSFIQAELLKNSSYIYRAILKHGFSSFRLEILEYCDPAKVIEREQINPSGVDYYQVTIF